MDYDNEALVLRYEVHNKSGYDPCLRLLILKYGNAVFYRTGKTRWDADGPDRFLTLGAGDMEAVLQILSEKKLYSLGRIEEPAQNGGGSHTYDFYFAANGRTIIYRAADLEYAAGNKRYRKADFLFNVLERLGKVLVPAGVPAECFAPVGTPVAAPVRKPVSLAAATLTVFDFRKAKAPRMLGAPGREERLERYAFEKRGNGSYALTVQAGWPGASGHWDGAGNTFPLPQEWFGGGFEAFLEKLTAVYPAKEYGFSAGELAEVPGLRAFLGFANNTGDLKDAAAFRSAVHKEALMKVQRSKPEIGAVIDPYPVEAYLQKYWDYPGAWYTMVSVPESAGSREALINAIVENTLAHNK